MVRCIGYAENKACLSQFPGDRVPINRARLWFRRSIWIGLYSVVILINSLLDLVLNVRVRKDLMPYADDEGLALRWG